MSARVINALMNGQLLLLLDYDRVNYSLFMIAVGRVEFPHDQLVFSCCITVRLKTYRHTATILLGLNLGHGFATCVNVSHRGFGLLSFAFNVMAHV